MTQLPESSVALRMGLASKALPEISLEQLVRYLSDSIPNQVTEKKLRNLSPVALFKDLQQLDQSLERSHFNQAFAILTCLDVNAMAAPEVKAKQTALEGPKIRVAISSNHQENIDGHFNSCLRFLIYEVNEQTIQLIDVRPADKAKNGNSRPETLIKIINDCDLLVTLSIGGPAAAKVIRNNIHPLKINSPTSCITYLQNLHSVIASPPPWLEKKLKQ